MQVKRFFTAMLSMVLLSCLTVGCRQNNESTADFYAMDTAMTLTVYGKNADRAVSETQAEVNRLEILLSRTREDSDISKLNCAGGKPVEVDDETAAILEAAQKYSQATEGAFDPTIAPIVSAWGFTTDHYQIPPQAELDQLLTHVGIDRIHLDTDSRITLDAETQIDLGGIAKGYASDQAALILSKSDLSSAMVSLGGNVYVKGSKPDGSPWRVAVQDPAKPSGFAGVLSLRDEFAVTSGGYQRYFEQDGKQYHHIIDPKTGYPAEGGLTSVTVVKSAESPDAGTMCDAFSTALYVMGEKEAVNFWRSGKFDFDLVLITNDSRILVTEGIADQFKQETSSEYVYETIGRTAS